MEQEYVLMKGNEAIAEAAIRAGVDAFFGYPITPQTEIIEYFASKVASGEADMAMVQAESETATINMVYGAAGCGRRVMTSSSSPGISLMCEGISYLAGAELPCLIVNVARGGPGLGTIQPSQSDYFQTVKGGGHGDYKLLTLAPNSVQESADFVSLGFKLAFKYRNPVMILSDGVIGQMMEKVKLPEREPKLTEYPSWACTGHRPDEKPSVITSLNLDPYVQEVHNQKLQAKYARMVDEEVRYETIDCEDADYLIVAYGASSRIAHKTIQLAREEGIKIGIFRPITLFPFPSKELEQASFGKKGILSVEMSAGQMIEDIRLAVHDRIPVMHYGRNGGVVHTPEDILGGFKRLFLS